MHRATQVPLIEFIGAFVPIEVAFKVEMAKVDIGVQKHLADAITFIASRAKALLLREAQWRVRGSDSGDAWLVQSSSLTSEGDLAFPGAGRQVLRQVGI